MDFNIEIRKKQLDNLDQLISSSSDRIESILHYLGWSAEGVQKEDSLLQCPVDHNHRISPKSWNLHVGNCVVKREGYDLKEQFLSESLPDSAQSIYLDRNKKIETITKELTETRDFRLAWNGVDPDPRTSDRLISTYSADERLAFYNYSIHNTTGPPAPPEFTTIHNKNRDEDKAPTYEELLAQERDARRRRAKYKSVHINKKNHTEVIREVINGQMDEYKEWLLKKDAKDDPIKKECSRSNGANVESKEKIEEHERPHSSISKTSAHSSSSKSASRKYDNHRDRRGRSGDRLYESRDRDRRRRDDDKYRRSRDRRSYEERTDRTKFEERRSGNEGRGRYNHNKDEPRR